MLQIDRCQTGIAGLDDILFGGFPRDRLYLIEGSPGVGKTTLALQFLLAGRDAGEQGLYVTLSETQEELNAVADSHGWSLDGIALFELSAIEENLSPEAQNTLLHPSEVELTQTTQLILDEVVKSAPLRIAFDSLSELRLLAQNPLRYRRQLLALKQFFAKRHCTVLLLDDDTANAGDSQVHSLAHGVLALERLRPLYGSERRRLSMIKLRGSSFRGGYHDYTIRTGGLDVFPRLVAAEHHTAFNREAVPSGVAEFDELLRGGLHRGTSNLLMGPAGTGKSSVALQYALCAARRGERIVYFAFDENLGIMAARAEGLGMNLTEQIAKGNIRVHQVDPAELSPGEFANRIRQAVEQDGVRFVVLDSLNGYLQAMPEEQFLVTQLHEMLSYLSQQGVVTLMVLTQHGLIGQMQTNVDLTYLADTVIVLRYFEAMGAVKKAIAVIKKRSGGHENTIREFTLDGHGLRVGKPLVDFHGILTGTPEFRGSRDAIMKGPDVQVES